MKNSTRQKKCIYCGKEIATERDHVPPKCLFPKPPPPNVITVPSCKGCNHSLSKDEEYFRAIVSQLADTENHPASKRLLKDKILRGFEERPKLAVRILSTVKPVDIIQDGMRVATIPAYDVDNQSYDRVMVKIIKGLLYHETGQIVSAGLAVKWNVLHQSLDVPQPVYDELQKSASHIIGEGIFEYKAYILPNTVKSLWLMSFYGGAAHYGAIFDESHFA